MKQVLWALMSSDFSQIKCLEFSPGALIVGWRRAWRSWESEECNAFWMAPLNTTVLNPQRKKNHPVLGIEAPPWVLSNTTGLASINSYNLPTSTPHVWVSFLKSCSLLSSGSRFLPFPPPTWSSSISSGVLHLEECILLVWSIGTTTM